MPPHIYAVGCPSCMVLPAAGCPAGSSCPGGTVIRRPIGHAAARTALRRVWVRVSASRSANDDFEAGSAEFKTVQIGGHLQIMAANVAGESLNQRVGPFGIMLVNGGVEQSRMDADHDSIRRGSWRIECGTHSDLIRHVGVLGINIAALNDVPETRDRASQSRSERAQDTGVLPLPPRGASAARVMNAYRPRRPDAAVARPDSEWYSAASSPSFSQMKVEATAARPRTQSRRSNAAPAFARRGNHHAVPVGKYFVVARRPNAFVACLPQDLPLVVKAGSSVSVQPWKIHDRCRMFRPDGLPSCGKLPSLVTP